MKVALAMMLAILQVVKAPGPAVSTYNLIQDNVQSITMSNVGGGTYTYTCSGFTFMYSSVFSKLYDGSVDINKKTTECICGQSASSYNDQQLVIRMTTNVPAGVKTIILTSTPDSYTGLTVQLAISTDGYNYTTICSSCILGSNSFDSWNSNTGLAAFNYLKVVWYRGRNLCLCEVWAYKYKNYVPTATAVTGYGSGVDSASVSFSRYKTTPTFICLKDQTPSASGGMFYTGGAQTCIFNNKNNGLTFIVIDFAQPMIFYEIHSSGGTDADVMVYLIDPRSSLMKQTAGVMVSTITPAPYSQDITKFVSYPSPTGEAIEVFKHKQVTSTSCSQAECQAFGATRVVVANDATKDFFTCGFAIMADLLSCPPTSDQCLHAVIAATTLPQTSMTISALSTMQSSTFVFKDNLSTFCGSSNVCGFQQTFTLSCIDCYTCSSGLATCGGTCQPATTPSFQHTFVTVSGGYKLQVTDDQSQQINHKCNIIATFNDQTITSSNQITIKATCGLCSSTTYVTTSVPNFATPIPIGSAGKSASFTAFTDTVTICGSICTSSLYTIYCRLATDTTGIFMTQQSSWLWSGAISGSGSSLSFYANSLSFSNHLKTYTCKLQAYQPDAQIYKDSASTFDVTFDMCINAAQSCPWDYWIPITSAWIAPSSFSVYLDGVSQGTSFIYTNWQNYFSTVCPVNFCGTLTYTLIDTATNLPLDIPSATILTTMDTVNQVVSISIATTSPDSVGEYEVQVYGFVDNTGIWTGTKFKSYSSTFTIKVVDPCTQNNPCQFTKVLNSVQVLTTMTIYLDNIAALQAYDLMDDYISNFCQTQCTGQVYTLIDVATNTPVPSDLAVLTTVSGLHYIKAKTTNYLYTGTYNVRIKCTQFDTTGYSELFDIIVVACDTRSCQSTVLNAPVASAELPSSYTIGVDNVAGQTTCALFTNTVGSACTTNPLICGAITYNLVETSSGLMPSFTSLTVGTSLVQSSQTTDITLNGPHVVQIVANLDLTSFGYSKLTKSTDFFTITVNYCSPLPCNYNTIILPNSGLPQDFYVYTNGTVATATFPSYTDTVSVRCSNPYVSQCGAINYYVEDQSGIPLPLSISVVYDAQTSLWQIQTSNIDLSLVNVYQLQIHASFAQPPLSGVASDNTVAKFQLIVDYANQCIFMNCTRNSIQMTRQGYIEPQNMTIDVSMNWNQTIFDSFNDTKTSACWKQPGSTAANEPVASWDRPVCGFPIYEIVDKKGQSITKLFGTPNVVIAYYQDTEFTQQFIVKVRTNLKSLTGAHKVRLSVKLQATGIVQYSQPFYIIVVDPCNPYDCTITTFLPGLPQPSDIHIGIGQGYVTSKQGLWSDTISNLCAQSSILCGSPSFVLLMDDLSPVPFGYSVNQNSQGVSVSVIITDETQKGQTYNVVLQGFGFDRFSNIFYGLNGTSEPFQVIVSTDSVINPNTVQIQQPPVFTTFPPNLQFNTNGITQIQHYTAVAFSRNSTIAQIIVSLNNAITMVDYTLDGSVVYFDISLLNTTLPGTFRVDVKAIDLNGMFVSQQFTINAVMVITEDITIESNQILNLTNPLTASITEITSLGLLTISYNRRVVPVTDIDQITSSDFYIYFEQLSYEQPLNFNYTVVGMTPDQVVVQLNFSTPLDVSQGTVPDNVFVYMFNGIFMVEDVQGIYKDWQKGDLIQNTTLPKNRTKIRNYGVHTNKTAYYHLQSSVPKQLNDLAQFSILQTSINWLTESLKVIMWGSFAMHLIGFGSMEYVWIIFTNLQIVATLSSFVVQMPLNLVQITNSYSDISNSMFIPVEQVYNAFKYYASDSEDQSLNIYGQPIMNMRPKGAYYKTDYNEDDRRLTDFTQSSFYSKGASDLVVVTGAQMIILLACLFLLYVTGLVIKLTIYDLLPTNVKNAFNYIRQRVFWNLPLRMLLQQYQCLTFAALLNMKFQSQMTSTEQKVNFISACVVLALYSIGLIICITAFILKYQNQLQEWKKQFDSLFLSVKTDKRWASLAVSFSLLRKLLLMIVALTIDVPALQLVVATIIQLSYTCYIMLVTPMDTKIRNFVEIVNELTLLIIVTLMFTLTDLVEPSSIKYSHGWIIIYLMVFQICFNGVCLLLDSVWHMRRCRKVLRYKYFTVKNNRIKSKHNRVVAELSTHKKAGSNKMKNPILFAQLKDIESEGRQQESSRVSSFLKAQEEQKQQPLTIQQKKAEFETRMQELRKDEKPYSFEEGTMKVQQKKREDEQWQWQQDHSRASDWDALPKGYKNSQMVESISLFSDSVEEKIKSPVGMHNLLERSFEVNED